jgi:IS5 family transposase
LFVEIRRRMGAAVFEQFHQAIIDQMEGRSGQDDQEPPGSYERSTAATEPETKPDQTGDTSTDSPTQTHQDRLILDVTVAEQAIRFPTDLGLLNESWEISERLIDALYPHSGLPGKPQAYRQQARQAYLVVVKQRHPGGKQLRRGIKHQL